MFALSESSQCVKFACSWLLSTSAWSWPPGPLQGNWCAWEVQQLLLSQTQLTSLCTYHCELSRLFRTSVLFWQCCWLRCVDVTVKLHVYSCVLSSSLESLGLHVSSDLSVCHSHYIYLIILHALLWRTCHVCSFLKMVVHSLFSGCRWDLSRSMQNDANSHELLTRKKCVFGLLNVYFHCT